MSIKSDFFNGMREGQQKASTFSQTQKLIAFICIGVSLLALACMIAYGILLVS